MMSRPSRLSLPLAAAAVLLFAAGAPAGAQEAEPAPTASAADGGVANGCAGPSRDCVAVGRWNFDVSLGAGVRTDPVAAEANIPLILIPHVSYYGERVFLEDLDFGVTLIEGAASTLSLIASPGYDRVYFYRSDLQNYFVTGVPFSPEYTVAQPTVERFPPRARDWTYLAGPEWTFATHGVSGQLDVLHEVTGQNNGTEVRAALGIPLLESRGKARRSSTIITARRGSTRAARRSIRS
jgi:MipA family protein